MSNLNDERIQRYLKHPVSLRVFDSIDSTNTYAKAWAREGAPHPAVVIASQQSAGRGRLGRSFFSPEGGLYLSLIVHSNGCSPGNFTTLAAVAAHNAIWTVTGLQTDIKWVNDLLMQGKKVCGILAEGVVLNQTLSRIVIGIGINTGSVDFPEDLQDIAGTLHQAHHPVDREQLAARLINEILNALPDMPAHMPVYRSKCITIGRKVSFINEGKQTTGHAVTVDDDGALLVETENGPVRLVAGEVSILKG